MFLKLLEGLALPVPLPAFSVSLGLHLCLHIYSIFPVYVVSTPSDTLVQSFVLPVF